MPKTKELIRTFNRGTVHEYEETTETHWVGIVGGGPTLILCDNDAKETGIGTWCIYMPGKTGHRSSWNGKIDSSEWWKRRGFTIPFEDIAWVKQRHVSRTTYEKDYS